MNTANEGFLDPILTLKKRLPEVTDKERILSTIKNIRQAIYDQLNPTLDDLFAFFGENGPVSKFGKSFKAQVVFESNIRNEAEWFNGITHSVDIVKQHLDVLEYEVSKGFIKRLITEAATFRELNILGYVDVLFKYVDRLMKTCYVLAMEEAAATTKRPYRPSRGSFAYNSECSSFVTRTMGAIKANGDNLAQAIKNLANAEVTEETVETLATTRPTFATRLHPAGFLSSKWNIFFSAYKIYVEYQVNTYNRRKTERQALQLALQQAKEEREDAGANGDKAKVQRWIDSLEGRIERLDSQISNFEKEYDLED